MRKEERGREGTGVKCAGCVAAGHAIYKRSSYDYEKYAKLFHRDSAKGIERGGGRGAARGRVKVERGFIKFKINCSNVVFSCFARVANVLHVCQLGAWPAGSVARREREVQGVTRSGYATCAPLLRH